MTCGSADDSPRAHCSRARRRAVAGCHERPAAQTPSATTHPARRTAPAVSRLSASAGITASAGYDGSQHSVVEHCLVEQCGCRHGVFADSRASGDPSGAVECRTWDRQRRARIRLRPRLWNCRTRSGDTSGRCSPARCDFRTARWSALLPHSRPVRGNGPAPVYIRDGHAGSSRCSTRPLRRCRLSGQSPRCKRRCRLTRSTSSGNWRTPRRRRWFR